ncbi:hypothetical protein JFU37_17905 [Pseudomonas sp. TH41]|uniref:hypothetical protein n=1 Tax=Pseudomonas sp. TH41 TaxID=2796405 RepID=UPI0019145276|nr:hypothetical protein [Pseudomonas sp. TH41]MBK5354369.1 hypothetical protein [Pseudomonas sp. TH41]
MGTSINCNLTRPTLENILEALYVLIYGVTETLKYPRGYHVRTRFTDQMTSSEYSAHINNFYKSKSKYSPQRMTIIENDDTGVHHHHAIILNDKLDRKSSLQYLHAKLKKNGKLNDYSIICPKHDSYGHSLTSTEDLDSYFEWMTYLAKTKSKPDRHQLWSGSRLLTSMLKDWRRNGKPDLRIMKSRYNAANSTEFDLSALVA